MISALIGRASLRCKVLLLTLLFVATGCAPSTPSAPPPAQAALPPLTGVYRAPTGDLITIAGPGTFRSTGAGGRFTVSGNRVDLVRDDGKSIQGHRPDADRLVLSLPGVAPMTFYRVGSAAAQTPEALNRPAPTTPAEPPQPAPDPDVPLDRYTAITDQAMLQEIIAAFAKNPLSEQNVAALLPDPPTTEDAFARRERVQRDGAAVIERLKTFGANRYYKLSTSTVEQELPRTAADFARTPRFVWTILPGGFQLKSYNFERKGFPVACLDQGRLTINAMPYVIFSPRQTQKNECFLPVPDEAVARVLEAQRAAGSGTFQLQGEVHFFAVERRGHPLAAIITHVNFNVLRGNALDGSNVLASFSVSP